MKFKLPLKNIDQDIIKECVNIFNENIISELKRNSNLQKHDKLEIYINKINNIEIFFQKKKFPIKDDYNLVYFENFNKKLIIGWEKHVEKYRILLIILYLIMKIAINRILKKINQKIIILDNSISNTELEELIEMFIKIFYQDIKLLEKKESNLNNKLKKELEDYQNHVKHFFNQ
ncbi:MAG: hypothetical protein EAX96_00780 [Candidatus Lokiarchaeota archaeon]|nr:hypothetical protein [Candidatus Lokiarchaeota archaeon]